MPYIKRSLEAKFLRMNHFFKVMLVTGARQVGKTTMLRHLAGGTGRTYVTMDNLLDRELARRDPALFFQRYQPPILIDEIQKAPELLDQIKLLADESDEPGRFWLTGSQHFDMMTRVRESLAGRVAILHLYGLSQQEKKGISFAEETDFTLPSLLERSAAAGAPDLTTVYRHIWQGGLPGVQPMDDETRALYFSSYISTYLVRDALDAGGLKDTARFGRFLKAAAALTAQQVNYKTLADASDISIPTAKRWLEILESLDVVTLLPPFYSNQLKRLTKTPKLYFNDTGLAAYLSLWLTADTLMAGAASGAYFENYVVLELLKSYATGSHPARLSYYRDAHGKEIDVIIEQGNVLRPLEIKRSAHPDTREVRKFSVLDKTGLPRGRGGIVCMAESPLPIDGKNAFIPCTVL